MIYRSAKASQILGELGLSGVFFPSESEKEKEDHCKRIIRYIAFRQGRIDSQTWIADMDGEKEMPQILGDMIINQTQYRPIDGLSRSPYHVVFTDLALIEGATGLDLSSEDRLKHAVMHYWSAVKKTIQLFKLQYQVHKEDQAAKAAIKISVEAPPIAMENTEASADVATPVLQI